MGNNARDRLISYLTVVEDAADVFRVDGAGEMGVTVMPSLAGSRGNFEEFIANEVFGANHFHVLPGFRRNCRERERERERERARERVRERECESERRETRR